jgi:uncharacterized protein
MLQVTSDSRLLFGSDAFGPLLSHLLSTPGRRSTLAEIERATAVPHESAFRALQRMLALGIATRTTHGRQTFYQAQTMHPLYRELKALAVKAFGIGAELGRALEELPQGLVDYAFLFGSAADGTDSTRSDIDLFVVGRARLHDLSPHLAAVERRLGREVQVICRTPEQVRAALAQNESFYTEVWSGPRVFLIGEEDVASPAPADPVAAVFTP